MDFIGNLDAEIRHAGLHAVRVLAAFSVIPAFGTGPATRFRNSDWRCSSESPSPRRAGTEDFVDPGSDPLPLLGIVFREFLFGILLVGSPASGSKSSAGPGPSFPTRWASTWRTRSTPPPGLASPLVAHVYEIIALTLFFIMGAHHAVIVSVVRSFDAVPPGAFAPDADLLGSLTVFGGGLLEASVRVAAPVFVAMIVLTVAIALLARVAPQWNILDASYPIRIGAGLALLVLTLPVLRPVLDAVFERTSEQLFAVASEGVR
jgi:flagellar biosynthetic protein FliR